MKRKYAAYVCVALASILLILLSISVWAIQAKGYVYYMRSLPYFMMASSVILYLVGWFLLVGDPHQKKNLVIFILLALVVILLLYATGRVKRQQYIAVNEDRTHSVIMRFGKKRQLIDLYERRYFLLAGKTDTIQHVKALIHYEWKEDDQLLLEYVHTDGTIYEEILDLEK